jgi:hypothetical protein
MASARLPLTLDWNYLLLRFLTRRSRRCIARKDAGSKTVHRPIRFQIPAERSPALFVQCDYVVIAASERTCPRSARSFTLQIFKHLSRESRALSASTLHAERAKIRTAVSEGKDVAGRLTAAAW